jgi:hypothetical protein
VVALVDVSDSMSRLSLTPIAKRLAAEARPGDAFRMGTFAARVAIGRSILVDNRAAEHVAREITQEGGASPLWDGLEEALTTTTRSEGRRAVIVFSDAMATANRTGSADVLLKAHEVGAVVFALGIPDRELAVRTIAIIGRNDGLRRLALDTGGEFREARDTTDSPEGFMSWAIEEIRQEYRVEFTPTVRDGRLHRIEVSAPGAELRSPTHYRAPRSLLMANRPAGG